MGDAKNEREVRCPRCDYDLRGDPASREAAGESRGVCAECGLTFVWGDVRDPHRLVKPWSFEHAKGWVRGAWCFVATGVRVVVPWVFWKHFSVESPLRVRRAVLWGVLAVVVPYVVNVLMQVVLLSLGTGRAMPSLGTMYASTPMDVLFAPWTYPLDVGVWRPGHPVTVDVFGASWVIGPTDWNSGIWGLLLTMVVVPVTLLLLPETRARARVRVEHVGRAVGYSVCALAPLAFAALAVTLFAAEWEALWRPPRIEVWRWGMDSFDFGRAVIRWLPLAKLLMALWVVVWWVCAVRSWRLTRPGEVYVVLWVIGGLCVLITFVLSAM